MKVLLDTNVMLDIMLERDPFWVPTAHILAMMDAGILRGVVCATTATNTYYIAAKAVGKQPARDLLRAFLELVEVAPVSRNTLELALNSKGPDFEDNVVAESARFSGADVIVTRDRVGFQHAECSVMSPEELLSALRDGGGKRDD